MRSSAHHLTNTERVPAFHPPPQSPSPVFALILECAREGLVPFQLVGDDGSLSNASRDSHAYHVTAHKMGWELVFSMSNRVLTLTRCKLRARTAEPEIIGAVGIQGTLENWFFVVQGTSAQLPPGLDEFRREFGGIGPMHIDEDRARQCVGVLFRAFLALAKA